MARQRESSVLHPRPLGRPPYRRSIPFPPIPDGRSSGDSRLPPARLEDLMPETILLVEDNVDNRAVYRMGLEHWGYEVVEAVDGEEGVRLARERLPDLILMDVSLPKLDGYSAATMLKADPDTRAIPIVALTAHALAGEEEKALAAGCDGYLAKPVEPKRVVETVRLQIEAARARGEALRDSEG